MDNKLTRTIDMYEVHVSIVYGLGDLERRVCGCAFKNGAEWQQDQDKDTGRDFDPVPAWFGYVPAKTTLQDDDDDYSGPFPDKNIGDY